MGWFLPTHVDQGFIFGFLGAWHMYNTLRSYVRAPTLFRMSTWFPAHGRGLPDRFKPLELWILFSIIVIFIIKQLSHATTDIAAGVIQMEHLGRFQHVVFALFFLVYTVTGLVSEYTSLLELPAGALHCVFASGFLMELVVFHYGHHPGEDLESFVHMLMQLVLLVLVLLMFLEVLYPRSILLSVGRCMMLIFKGTWFAQIGFILHYPSFVPMGCYTDELHEYPVCPSHETLIRAKSLQVLIFNWQLLCIVVGTLVSFGTLLFWSRQRSGTPGRPILPSILVPHRNALTPRTKEKEASVYFQVPEEGDGDRGSGESDDEGAVDAQGTAVKSLARRTSSRNTRGVVSTPGKSSSVK